MKTLTFFNRSATVALAAALAAAAAVAAPAPAIAQAAAPKPTNDVLVAVGAGRLLHLNGTMSDLFVANDNIADVQVRSTNSLYIFGKQSGETTIYATNKAGRVVYSANIRVGANYDSLGSFLRTAMPEAKIQATPMNGLVLLTGTVQAPEDVDEANRLVEAYVGEKTRIISRLKTATPLQVMLRVRFAEVSRSFGKDVGFNILTRDDSKSGFLFGLFNKGDPGSIEDVVKPVFDSNGLDVINPATGKQLQQQMKEFTWLTNPAKYTIGGAGTLLGVDVLASLELAENQGRATILAEPTLTALSGETASFLAGGEFPIPVSQSLGSVSIEYKQYGVGLAFTPTVLEDGRISMRVRPEVSELTDQGSVRLNNFTVPALTTRRAETTVELGSGQSFMIGGLLRNTANNTVDKAPWLGDLPILGNLFRSNSYRKQESELVIIVTPYLVRPVSDSQIALPTDGYRISNDAQRILLDQDHDSRHEPRPGPTVAPARESAPTLGASTVTGSSSAATAHASVPKGAASPTPGFTF